MRKLSKKISMLMVLAMLVSLFSGIVSASAASAWSFASSKYDVDVKETIVMDKNEYADFDLYKDGEEVTKATYTVKWASSDEDVVWVNAKTGQLRADKFGEAEAGDKAKISATFTNVKTKKSATRYFYIEIADDAKYEIAVNFGDEAFVVGQKYDLAATVKADGKEVEAKVEFSIDGKAIDAAYTPAKAGEVTIVAVATVDGKEVAKAETKVVVAEAGLVSAKQITFDTVALTFGSADVAKAVAADKSKLGSVYLIIENEIQAFVEKIVVDEKNPAVANVTLYNNLVSGTTYKFTYGDKTLSLVGVNCDASQARSISIATTKLAANNYNGDDQQVYLNLYNADGVLIKVVDNGFKLEALNHDAYNINGTGVYFHKVGAVAQLKATYFYGYDNQGNKIPDLEAVGAITSYDAAAFTLTNINEWSFDGADFAANNSKKLEIGESGILKFKFKRNNVDYSSWDVIYDGTNLNNAANKWADLAAYPYGYGIIFESSNENVILVDKTSNIGEIYAVGAGHAQVIVYRYNEWWEGNKQAIGVFNVEVVKNRTLVSANSTADKTILSNSADDAVKIYPNALDQIGRQAYDIGNVYVGVKLMYTPDAAVGAVKLVGKDGYETTLSSATEVNVVNYLKTDWKGDKYFEVKVPDHSDMYGAKNIQVGVITKQWNPYKEITKVINISTKAARTDRAYLYQFKLEGIKNAIDMNLVNWNNWNIGEFQTAIKLTQYDDAGYLVKVLDTTTEFYAGEAAAEAAHVDGADTFFYTIIKDGWDDKWTDKFASDNNFTAVAVTGSSTLEKICEPGTYTINAYRFRSDNGMKQFLTSTTIVVSDTTPAVTAIKKDNKLDSAKVAAGNILGALAGKIGYYRNGAEVYSISTVGVDADVHVNSATAKIDRVHVKTVTVSETYCGKTYTWDVDVYMSYEVPQN